MNLPPGSPVAHRHGCLSNLAARASRLTKDCLLHPEPACTQKLSAISSPVRHSHPFPSADVTNPTVSGLASVDGPRRRGQMEAGSHDHLQEGLLSLGLTNGESRRCVEEEAGGLGAGAAGEGQKRAACELLGQIWGPGQDKTDHFQQEQLQMPCWGDGEVRGAAEERDMENARSLVALAASMGTSSPCSHPEQQVHTAQLYEKFKQEMGGQAVETQPSGMAAGRDRGPPEDLSTLQIALSQARHGNKPPNCNCEGPDCPDYMEWLEKKIQMVVDDQEKKQYGASGVLHQSQQEQAAHLALQLNRATPPVTSSTPSHTSLNSPMPCSLAPIPCSPSVLSIAKEKNISLQTAIAIEALTQLSATVPQPMVPPADASSTNHHQVPHHLPPHSQHSTHLVLSSTSPRPQSVPPGIHPQLDSFSWEHRRQVQTEDPKTNMLVTSMPGPALHSSPHPHAVSPFPGPTSTPGGPLPPQWQTGPRKPHMTLIAESQPRFTPPPRNGGDPMSELKQLLGDTSGKYANPAFRSPAPQHLLHHGPPGLGGLQIKQEMDSGEYPGSNCAAMERYGAVANGRPLSPGSATVRHLTQASLQQYLHHKRNLFSSTSAATHHPPFPGCQDLRKWWPNEGSVPIKQEPKEPKKKKSYSSPSLKQPLAAGLLPQLGPTLPKPKQIVIKKPKQKASQPTFLPQAQISFQKPPPSRHENILPLPAMANLVPALLATEPGPLPAQTPAHPQESVLNSALAEPAHQGDAESGPTLLASSAASLPQGDQAVSGPPVSGDSNLIPGTTSLPSTPQPAPSLSQLGALNPKLEELIRQFEAEFEDAPLPGTQSQTPEPNPAQPNSNSGQAVPPAPASSDLPAQPAVPAGGPLAATGVPLPEGETMDIGGIEENGSAVQAEPPQTSAGNGMEQQCNGDASQGVCPSSQAPASAPDPLLQLQQQQHRVLEDPFTVPFSPLPKRMKIESSGDITVLSTTTCLSTASNDTETPTKLIPPSSPSLRGFLESPLRYLDTPTKSLLDTPAKDAQAEFPLCDCVEQFHEKDDGPYYNHLGAGPTVASIRELMENRFGEKGEAIRIEKVVYTGKEGKSSQGCPIAKWVIRRSCEAEKVLCLVKQRVGHHCENAVIIVVILIWEGVPRALGDHLYREVTETLTKFGNPTSRRCGLNEDRTCACQGKDLETCGASFSFGCSWSMYFNGCKYARSKTPRKFRLQGDHPKEEENLRDNFQELATKVAPLYKQMAPKAYSNQCALEKTAPDCRLGLKEGRPFSGVTACMDFCAHAHKDQHNLYNGCTVVCTLTKEDNRMVGQIPDDEQLHVLPLYKVSPTDEFGSEENQRKKMQNGAIQVLNNFRREVRKLPEPAKSCRQRRLEAKKAASEKKKGQKQLGETPEKTIKMEMHHSGPARPQQANKAIPKQEVKPTIKTEAMGQFNGVLEGYPSLGNRQPAKAYSINNVYPHPGYYASGHASNGPRPPPPSPGAVNGFHSNPALHYGYYGYTSNALFPHQLLAYEGRNGAWPKAAAVAASFDKKPDVQSLQASLGHSYPDHPEEQPSDAARCGYPAEFAKSLPLPARPLSAPSEVRNRSTPIIKQEPADIPLYPDCAAKGSSRSCSVNFTSSPQPEAWPGHKPNGSLTPGASLETFAPPEKQQVHQHPATHHQQPQQHQQQWAPYPSAATPLASPAPSLSPSIRATPSPSSHHWDGQQVRSWSAGLAGYGLGPKQSGTTGAFPEKLWSKVGESRSSTPLGLQEKAWKSCGGSAAGSTPSLAPEGRLFPDAFQQADTQAFCEPAGPECVAKSQSEREQEEEEVWSDSEHNFLDPNIGGVAVAPAHGSILIECARRELHATTPLKKPDRSHPTRISLVFYQHKNLNQPCHGLALWEAKMKLLAERALQRQQEAALLGLSQNDIKAYGKKRKWGAAGAGVSPGPTQGKDRREGVSIRQASTQQTASVVTVSPYAFTQLTGPYSHWA
ncbi:methylcytosine dioxygenase TET3 isoform X3 [Paramormyrops kingsleyae]|uniref:methylcytosine dioxygenase TET3 isoform X3 n=1 Tax=Paramormyrops kingsleyae TaxID=1676925 RepID=UPI000CD6675D|nr:methylcytosine dioxygenase TET3 isoform X3 [Paramormyrops kingsleyae]